MAQTAAAALPSSAAPAARWKRPALWTAAGVLAFIFFLYLTFPYDTIKSRIVTEAGNAGWIVTMESIGPGLFGVTAHGVRLRKAQDVSGTSDPVPLIIDSIALRPSLIPLGLAFRANAFDGKIAGSVGGLSDLSVNASLGDLDPSAGNLKAFSGMDLSGRINGDLSLTLPKETRGNGYDLAASNGALTLDTTKLTIRGGTVTVPMYGTPTPMDLPRIALGDLAIHAKIDKGVVSFDKFRGASEDLQLGGGGSIRLDRRLELSTLNLDIRLKADPDFVKRLGLIGAGLSVLPPDKTDPTFRVAHITGLLGSPRLQQ